MEQITKYIYRKADIKLLFLSNRNVVQNPKVNEKCNQSLDISLILVVDFFSCI